MAPLHDHVPPRGCFGFVALCRRVPGMELEEYIDYYRDVHAKYSVRMQGLLKYAQLPIQHSGPLSDTSHAQEYDSVSLYVFESKESYLAAMASIEGKEVFTDADRFMGTQVLIPITYQREFRTLDDVSTPSVSPSP